MTRTDPGGRSLDAAIAGLPREVAPEQDLWPGIAARIQPAPRRSGFVPFAAAAALAFVMVLGWQMFPRTDEPAMPPLAGGPSAVRALPADFIAAEANLLAVRNDRHDALASHLAALEPEQRDAIERSLGNIANALGELREALAEAPLDPVLQHLLLRLYMHELAVIGQVEQATLVADERRIAL